MSTIGWILLIALFVGAHLLMHRGHGSLEVGGRLPRKHHLHGAGEDDQGTTITNGPVGREHRGC